MELSGLFWPIDPPKNVGKCVPPAPTWLAADYLPGLEEAQRFDVPLFNMHELREAQQAGEQLICDIEEYQNYFLCAFMSMESGKCIYVEFTEKLDDGGWLRWILFNFQIVTFNGKNFDVPLLALALAGKTCEEIYTGAGMLIRENMKPWQMLQAFKVDQLELDHIDLIEVAPLTGSLKIYGGRLHVPKMQDLPFPPDRRLTKEQIDIVRFYCINDLTTTAFVNENLSEQLEIRKGMSTKYGVDLRSKSDAQVAEAVIKAELKRINGFDVYRPEILPGTSYRYQVPAFIQFQTEEMRGALELIRSAVFVVGESGHVITPPELYDPATLGKAKPEPRRFTIGRAQYKIGIGGLHSCEETIAHRANEQFKIVDRDVVSYYPRIILNQSLYPLHLGYDFLNVYSSIVERRIDAKRTKNKTEADMLKIVINGSFGKFSSKWSALYAPDLLIQVTLTGQLALLMLIESLELAGVQVCSANTDGVVFRHLRTMQDTVDRVVKEWEMRTSFETEETEYAALYSRDVNNYVAVKPDAKVKTKGAYFSPWGVKGEEIFRFHKNPTNSICVEAVTAWLTKGTPVETTVRACRDLTKFVTVRVVKGGAVKDGVFLGKSIRWYYAQGCGGNIVNAKTGGKVPKSDGAKPCMNLPDRFPDDIDFLRYEAEANEILMEIAAIAF